MHACTHHTDRQIMMRHKHFYDPTKKQTTTMERPHRLRRKLATTIFHQYDAAADDDDEYSEEDDTQLPNTVGWVFSGKSAVLVLLRKLGFGVLAAAQVCLVLVAVMVMAVLVGVGAVRMLAEEPVFLEEPLYFDYTEEQPSAKLVFGGFDGRKMERSVPVGHTFWVSLLLILPDSDYNLHVGVFQVTAEVMLATGDIMARSSRPCMLRFRSLPVRLIQTSIMSLPVIMGITGETQEIRVQILKYKEGYPRTEAIKVTLKPKAGSTALPELYAARVFINSQPPWRKELLHNWKWTFYVWSSLYLYIMLLMILVGCCKPIIFPMMSIDDHKLRDQPTQVVKDQLSNLGGDGAISNECSEAIRKWHQSISKRKSLRIRTWVIPEPDLVSSCASSITREKTGYGIEEAGETAPSESEYESC